MESVRELEAKLLILAEDPREVAARVASLRQIGEWRLEPHGTLRIHDRYLDTDRESLRKAGHSLRIRSIGGKRWITLKGPAMRDSEAGTVERDELDLPWSPQSLRRISAELAEGGVTLSLLSERGGKDSAKALSSLGLRIVQSRATTRRVLDLFSEAGGVAEAELAVDAVRYRFQRIEAWHHEVEVESKGPHGEDALRTAALALRQRFPELTPWTRGKLSTGRAVEQLAREGRLEALLGPGGDLTPAAYTRIEGRR